MCCFCCDGFCCPCKTFLCITNFLGFLASLVALSLAVWFYIDPARFGAPEDDHEAAIVLICLAVFFLITFLGCYGALTSSRSLLCVYLVLGGTALVWITLYCGYILHELTTTVGVILLSLFGILFLNCSTALYILIEMRISGRPKSKRPASEP